MTKRTIGFTALLALILAGCAAPNENRNNREIGEQMEADAQHEKEVCTILGDLNCTP
jgi:PBP1b-binding outer membrane lipoprotein LpoB